MSLTYSEEIDGRPIVKNKVDMALQRIVQTWNAFAGSGRLGSDRSAWVAFSGGKDSVVLLDLVRKSGIPFEAHYTVTSVDPPELVQFIKSIPGVQMDIPRFNDGSPITMWNLIPKRLTPPTRVMRYCCQALKESAGKGRLTLTGVRWAESSRRKNTWGAVNLTGKRKLRKAAELGIELKETGKDKGAFDPLDYILDQEIEGYKVDPTEDTVMLNNDNGKLRNMMEYCVGRGKTTLNPIIDWEEDDIWEYIEQEKIPYCCLYAHGGSVRKTWLYWLSTRQSQEQRKGFSTLSNVLRVLSTCVRQNAHQPSQRRTPLRAVA